MTVLEQAADDIIKRIKFMANLDLKDNRLPKIGHIRFSRNGLSEFRMTVNIYPTKEFGELVAMKICPLGETTGRNKFQDIL